jgi:hypothetical protein
MREQKLRPVRHVHAHEISGLHALAQQELRVATRVCVRLGPRIAAIARPDGLGGGGEAGDLGFELVPEGGAFACGYKWC